MPASSPLLLGLIEGLDAADEYIAVVAGPPPGADADRWMCVHDVAVDSPVIEMALAATTTVCGDVRDAGAAYLAGWVAELAVVKAFGSMAATGRTWVLDPTRLWIRRHPEGWFDGLAIGDVPVRVVAADTAASGHHGDDVIVCADPADMARLLAADAIELLTPVFAAIRQRAPFGTRGMWGTAADSLVAGAAYEALRAGRDERDDIERARQFVDTLAAAGDLTLTRPTTLAIECAGRDVTVVQKGTCCLWYKVPAEATEEPGSEPGPHYCLSCPLVDDAVQLPKWRHWLESEYAHTSLTATEAPEPTS